MTEMASPRPSLVIAFLLMVRDDLAPFPKMRESSKA